MPNKTFLQKHYKNIEQGKLYSLWHNRYNKYRIKCIKNKENFLSWHEWLDSINLHQYNASNLLKGYGKRKFKVQPMLKIK
jgi:hypothetical protein